MATLCRERYLTREEMKTQYKNLLCRTLVTLRSTTKGGETLQQSTKAQISFLCLNQQKKNSFQRLLSSTPWNKLAITYNSKKRKCVTFTNTFAFCLI